MRADQQGKRNITMLNIYANAIRTATRTGPIHNNETPAKTAAPKTWLPNGHWWLRAERTLDETRR
jgi:hypothetical protein